MNIKWLNVRDMQEKESVTFYAKYSYIHVYYIVVQCTCICKMMSASIVNCSYINCTLFLKVMLSVHLDMWSVPLVSACLCSIFVMVRLIVSGEKTKTIVVRKWFISLKQINHFLFLISNCVTKLVIHYSFQFAWSIFSKTILSFYKQWSY